MLNSREIGVFDVPPTAISGEASTFYDLDLGRITVDQLDFTASYSTTLTRDVESLDAFTIWFDTYFLPHGSNPNLGDADALQWGRNGQEGVGMSTGPYGTATHWHQAVLLLDEKDRKKNLKRGAVLKGEVTYKKTRRDVRGIDVQVTWSGEGAEGKVSRPMA